MKVRVFSDTDCLRTCRERVGFASADPRVVYTLLQRRVGFASSSLGQNPNFLKNHFFVAPAKPDAFPADNLGLAECSNPNPSLKP